MADLEDDDEALRWAGDEEQGRAAPQLGRPAVAEVPAEAGDEPQAPGSRARAAAAAAFAVPYLAFTVLWILVVQRLTSGAGALATEILWQFGEFLAIVSAPAWFAATLSLTRESPPRVRVGWLALGLGMLVPWPFVLDLYAALLIAGNLS